MRYNKTRLDYVCQCPKCYRLVGFTDRDIYLDYSGFGYTALLINCPHCNSPLPVKYRTDKSLNINADPRYYEYH